jgi:hypothetical protein
MTRTPSPPPCIVAHYALQHTGQMGRLGTGRMASYLNKCSSRYLEHHFMDGAGRCCWRPAWAWAGSNYPTD